MSFMPSIGVVVRMSDGRTAIVSNVSPNGADDRVMFVDGHEEKTDAWKIADRLTDLDYEETNLKEKPDELLAELRKVMATR